MTRNALNSESKTDSNNELNDRLIDAVIDNDCSTITALVQAGANLNAIDPDCDLAPLHAAVGQYNYAATQRLLALNAKVDITDSYGWTALHVAVTHNQKDLVSLLLTFGANPAHLSHANLTPLDIAENNGFFTIKQILLNHLNNQNTTPAHASSPSGSASANSLTFFNNGKACVPATHATLSTESCLEDDKPPAGAASCHLH